MENFTLSLLNEDHVATSGGGPAWLAEMRKRAFSYYQLLPAEVSPLYNKYSGVSALRPEAIHLSAGSAAAEPFPELKERLAEIKTEIFALQVGNYMHSIRIPAELKNKGLVIESVGDALRNHEQLVKKTLLDKIDPMEDKFLALECSAFNSGLFVYVPRGLAVEQQITFVQTLPQDGSSSIARNIFVLEENSSARIVQQIYAPDVKDGKQPVFFELMENHIARNGELETATLQTMNENSMHFSNRKSFIERDARMRSYIGIFGASLSRYKIDNVLMGEGASAEHSEAVFGSGSQAFDVTANMLHLSPNSRGRVLAKSVMKDNAKSLFKGMIKIGKNARGSESYLAGHAILLDKGAKADAIPGLEIETNEVKATHSASVAQMDEEQLFYLMSRGFTKSGARRFIIDGFIEQLVRRLSPDVRAWTNYLLDSKWEGRPLMIRSDEVMKEIMEVEEARRTDTDMFEKHYKYR